MRVAVVGAGIAGTLLAWRLAGAARVFVDVYDFTGGRGADATADSGGLVRGFEPDPDLSRVAAQSLAELLASPTLRAWSRYQEVGSIYLLPASAQPDLEALHRWQPGSARCGPTDADGDLEPGLAVVERHAGYMSPTALRDAALASLTSGHCRVLDERVEQVGDGTVTTSDGATRRYDAVVLAAGAWTPTLLRRSRLSDPTLRTKLIQYAIVACTGQLPAAFVDATTGVYGRPDGPRRSLVGLPGDHWDVPAAGQRPDRELVHRSRTLLSTRFGTVCAPGRVLRVVARADCFSDRPGLALRPVEGAAALFTFTGGSGGAAKTALACSAHAAACLIDGVVRVQADQRVEGRRS